MTRPPLPGPCPPTLPRSCQSQRRKGSPMDASTCESDDQRPLCFKGWLTTYAAEIQALADRIFCNLIPSELRARYSASDLFQETCAKLLRSPTINDPTCLKAPTGQNGWEPYLFGAMRNQLWSWARVKKNRDERHASPGKPQSTDGGHADHKGQSTLRPGSASRFVYGRPPRLGDRPRSEAEYHSRLAEALDQLKSVLTPQQITIIELAVAGYKVAEITGMLRLPNDDYVYRQIAMIHERVRKEQAKKKRADGGLL